MAIDSSGYEKYRPIATYQNNTGAITTAALAASPVACASNPQSGFSPSCVAAFDGLYGYNCNVATPTSNVP